ncbi:hypothetical protein BJV77DRAFT_774432 [Russula vinacea]|nr:hypothetical protein BJV77DRAFT_774432 [Russula vinacea]
MASSVRSPILRIFGGRSRSTVRAPNQPDIVAAKDWRSLKLNIQPDSVHTIQDALAHWHVSRPQPVQVDKSSSGEVSQQVLLEALPPVLVLHLERFLYDAAVDGIIKISKSIKKPILFAPELEIPLEIMVPVAGKSVEPAHYKLYGVLYHRGESASSGQYTVDVLHLNGDNSGGEGWLHIDDEAVSMVRHEDVFGVIIMSRWMTGVPICCFTVAFLRHRHNILFNFSHIHASVLLCHSTPIPHLGDNGATVRLPQIGNLKPRSLFPLTSPHSINNLVISTGIPHEPIS